MTSIKTRKTIHKIYLILYVLMIVYICINKDVFYLKFMAVLGMINFIYGNITQQIKE